MEMLFRVNKMKSIYDLKNNPLGICIHKYVGCGDGLYLTCHNLNIRDRDLFTEDIMEAVKKSQGIVSEVLRDISLNAKAFILDDSDVEYTDW
jgi:hypothetical protein